MYLSRKRDPEQEIVGNVSYMLVFLLHLSDNCAKTLFLNFSAVKCISNTGSRQLIVDSVSP